MATWATAAAKVGGVDRAGAGRHLRQRRVVLHRHGRQREPGAAADQLEVRADRGDVDRLGRQRLGDLGEQAAGDQRGAVGVGLHLDADLAGDLVVEAGDVQPAVGHPQHHAGEHRHRRPAGQALRRPRHGVGERVALHSELHAMPPRRLGATGRLSAAAAGSGPPYRTLWRSGRRARARPRCLPDRMPRCRSGRQRPSTRSPTLMIGFCCLREITRRLHRCCGNCGEPASAQVSGLSTGGSAVENRGTNRAARPQAPASATVVHRLSTGYPPVIHRVCPQLWDSAVRRSRAVVPRTFNRPCTGSSTGGGQTCHLPYTSTSLSPGVVHSLWVTRELSTAGC